MRSILANSTLAFIAAFVITTFLHEFGHYSAYFLLGADPTLYHNYVQADPGQLGTGAHVAAALAGPLVSLVQGAIFALLLSRRSRSDIAQLLYIWIALLGLINFFGYLMMTPLSTAGDTGKVAALLGLEYSIRVAVAVLGLIVLIFLVLRIGRRFSRFIPQGADGKLGARYVYSLMFFPIIIGSIVNSLLALPAAALISILYPATAPYVIMSSFPGILKSSERSRQKPEIENGISLWLIFLTALAIVCNRLLTFGAG